MPWKNGGGSTLEFAVDPEGATLETGFRWRLSSAEVAQSGPFSSFPGMERWLLLLSGEGFEIDFGARGCARLREPLQPIRFQGDWPAWASLVGGPSTDLGLMVDPRRVRASLDVIRLDKNCLFRLDEGTTLFFVGTGTVSIPALDLHLGGNHLLRIENEAEASVELAPGLTPVALVMVRLVSV